MRCSSPLFFVGSKVLEFDNGGEFPAVLRQKLQNHSKGCIISRKDYTFYRDFYHIPEEFFKQVPCGQCVACRINYAKEWAVRCMLEARENPPAFFITLTYDDEHLPVQEYNGDFFGKLEKRDFQLFIKRMRKMYGSLRYFGCGEYGGETFRPHYHFISFGCDFDDLELLKIQRSKKVIYAYFTSAKLVALWGKGQILICQANEQTCSYTACYSLKKVGSYIAKDKALEVLSRLDGRFSEPGQYFDMLVSAEVVPKPFLLCSRRPGIARAAYSDELVRDGLPGFKVSRLRYYDKLFDLENKAEREWRSEARSVRASLNCERFTDETADIFERLGAHLPPPRKKV